MKQYSIYLANLDPTVSKVMKNKAVSTFDRFMADPEQKALFDKE